MSLSLFAFWNSPTASIISFASSELFIMMKAILIGDLEFSDDVIGSLM